MHALLVAVFRVSVLGVCVGMLPFVSLPEAWADKDSDKGRGTDKVIVTNTTANPVPVVIQERGTGLQRESVEILAQSVNDGITLAYTVPAGKRLTITDVIFGCQNPVFAVIYRNGVAFSTVFTNLFSHSYISGILFTENQTVSVSSGSGAIGFWQLRGFLE